MPNPNKMLLEISTLREESIWWYFLMIFLNMTYSWLTAEYYIYVPVYVYVYMGSCVIQRKLITQLLPWIAL